jgi:hypothetical protein
MNREKTARCPSLSAACSLLIGVLYLFVILHAAAVPSQGRIETGNFFEGYARDPALMDFLWGVMAAVSMASLALIPLLGRRLTEAGNEWIPAAEHFGIAGSIVTAAYFLTMLGSAPALALAYRTGDAVSRSALNAVGLPQIDPYHVLALGGSGIWFLILNWRAMRKYAVSGFHGGLGIVLGFFLWAAVAAAVIHSDGLDLATSAVGGLCAPVWFFLTAEKLLRPDWPRGAVRE